MKIYSSQSLYMSCFLIVISLFGLLLSCSEPVVINYFSASPTTVTKGQAVTLQWSVSGAARVNLNNDIGDVAHSGKAIVIPVATTTYVLTAINSSQTLTREISITVNTLPETSSTQADTTAVQNSPAKQEDNFIGTPAVLRYDNLDTVTDNYLSNQVAVWHTYAKQPGSVAVASAYYAGDTRRGSVGPAVVPVRSPLIILPLKDGMVCIVKNYANLSYQYYKITSTGYDNILDDAERLNQLGWGLMTTFSPERFPFKIQKINIAAVTNHTGPPEEYEKYHFVVRILDGNNKPVWNKVLPWSFFKSDTSAEIPPAFWKSIEVNDVTVDGDFSVEIMAESNDYSKDISSSFHYLALAYEKILGSKDVSSRSVISDDGKKLENWVKLYDSYGHLYGFNLCIRVEGSYLEK